MKIFSAKKIPAFSLVEIMVIISIVLVGMLGVLSLLLQNMQAQTINRSRFVAYQLAQEGIEVVRATRDLYSVNGYNHAFLEEFPYGGYIFSYDNGEFPQLEAYNGDQRSKNVCLDANNFYNSYHFCPNLDVPNTIFKRILKLEEADDGTNSYIRVISTVNWTEQNKNYIYTLETHLYDWY